MLSYALAEHLGTTVPGLTWAPTGIYPPGTVGVYVEHLPADPDVAVAVLTADGIESDSLLPWDQPTLQVRVRGDRDVRTSQQIAQAIYSTLHGLHDTELPDGTWLGLAVCSGSGPTPSAPDDEGRWQWVVGVDAEVYAPTAHRA